MSIVAQVSGFEEDLKLGGVDWMDGVGGKQWGEESLGRKDERHEMKSNT